MGEQGLLERIGLAAYASAALYAVGYALLMASMLVLAAAALALPGASSQLLPFRVELPAGVYAGLALALAGAALGVMFAVEVLSEARRAKRYGLALRTAAVPLTLFALSQALMGLGTALAAQLAAVPALGFLGALPALGAAGAVALPVGFRLYFSRAARSSPELQLVGAAVIVVAVVLMYVVAPSRLVQLYELVRGYLTLSPASLFGISLPPAMGPLASELRLETAALLLLAAFSVVAALLPRNAALSLADWVVPVAALVFSAGLAYSGFSAAQAVSGLLSLLPQLGQASGPFAWFAYSVTAVLALLMVGALLLGVGGLIASAALAVLLAAMAHAALQRFPSQ
jgi:hypothetical protein